jgi:hypothetical protein
VKLVGPPRWVIRVDMSWGTKLVVLLGGIGMDGVGCPYN